MMQAEKKTLTNCPLCGATEIAPVPAELSTLLSVSDVLVLNALENLGRRIVREHRGRFSELRDRPFHIAHTVWKPTPILMARIIDKAWDIIPALLSLRGRNASEVQKIKKLLTEYILELSANQEPHTLDKLALKFSKEFGLELREVH